MPTPPSVSVQTNSASSTIIPAPAGSLSYIQVLGYNLTADAPTNVTLQDDLGTVFDSAIITPAGSGLVNPQATNEVKFTLGKGRSLVLTNSGSANVWGSIQFKTPMAGY